MKKANCKHSIGLRITSAILVALMLVCSLPITVFANDATGPQFTIVEDHLGNTFSTDPTVKKVYNVADGLFEDAEAAISMQSNARSGVTPYATLPNENKGTFTASENYDFTIQRPSEAVGNIEWGVTDSYLLSLDVDSAGNATVYTSTAGSAIVTAIIKKADNTSVRYMYYIITELSEGVYKFKNKATNLYIELPGGDISAGTEYIQWSLEYNRNSQFKITSTGSGIYTIRSMVANTVGMRKSSSNMLVNAYIGTSNDPYYIDDDASLWMISSDPNGYYVYNYSGANGRYTITPTDTTSGYDSKFTLTNKTGALNQHWSLVSQGASQHGVDIRNSTSDLLVGNSFKFSATMYSSYPDANGEGGFVWSVTNDTGSATIDENTGILTGIDAGTVKVTASHTYTSSTGSTRTWSADFDVYIFPFEDGMYYFRNVDTLKYMQPDEDGHARMEQHDFDQSDVQKWNLVYVGGGYYNLINEDSGLYLTSDETNSDGETVYHQIYNSWISRRQKWEFDPLSNGSYKVQSEAGKDASLVLAASSGWDILSSEYIEQRLMSEAGTKGEWIVEKTNEHVHLEILTRIFYNSTLDMTEAELNEMFEEATEAFLTEYNIKFTNSYVMYSNELDLSTECNSSDGANCEDECGALLLCGFVHHTGADRLINAVKSDDYFTISIVDYGICRYELFDGVSNHQGIAGRYLSGGCIVSIPYSKMNREETENPHEYPTRVLQHELTHRLGPDDDECSDQECAIKDNLNHWCDNCAEIIRDNWN